MNNSRKPFQLRLPDDVKEWVAAQAKRNGSPMNSVVIRALRDAMERTENLNEINHKMDYRNARSHTTDLRSKPHTTR